MAAEATLASHRPRPATVFIVDDDPSFLRSLERLLRATGFPVEAFPSAGEFLARRRPEAPGRVVADLLMPGMNGIELQEKLAKSVNSLPVVFVTGHGDIRTSVEAMKHGAEDFLTKRAPGKEHGVSRDLARLLLDDIHRCLDHFGAHPVTSPLAESEAGGYHH